MIIFAIRGLLRGIIKEAFSLLGIFGGIILGLKYNDWIYHVVKSLRITHPVYHKIIGFLAVFILFFIAMLILGEILSRLFKALALSTIDRIFGFFAGAAEGFLLSGFTIFILSRVPVFQSFVMKGEIARYVYDIIDQLLKKL